MKKSIFLFIAVVLLLACANEQKKIGRPVNHEIDFDYNNCVEDFDLGTLTDSVMQIIPLETTDEALIANIDKIEIRNNQIYIMDQLAKSVYVYDMNGKYLNRINKVGQGPGEYTNLSYMTITDSVVIVLDHFIGKQIEYQIPSLQFWQEERIFDKFWSTELFYLPAAGLICYLNDWGESQSGNYLLFTRKENTIDIDKQLPFEKEPFCLGISDYEYAIANNCASIIYSGNDTIYHIDNNGKAIPEYFLKIKNDRIFYTKKIENVYRDNPPGRVFGMNSINESDKYLFLNINVKIKNGTPQKKGNYSTYICLYDKQNQETVIYPHYACNSKFDNQRVFVRRIIDNKIIDWWDADIVLADKDYVFTKREFKNKTFEKQLKQVMSNITADDNPVLFIYNLK
jgi:hypothetical protein